MGTVAILTHIFNYYEVSMSDQELTAACNVGVRNVQRIQTLEKDSEKQWDAITQLQNRPPVWVTFVIAALSAVTGSALTFAGIMSKMVGAGPVAGLVRFVFESICG